MFYVPEARTRLLFDARCFAYVPGPKTVQGYFSVESVVFYVPEDRTRSFSIQSVVFYLPEDRTRSLVEQKCCVLRARRPYKVAQLKK